MRSSFWVRTAWPPRGPASRPVNHRLPLALRLLREEPASRAAPAESPLALLEAALLVADEPVSARRLAVVVGVEDSRAVARLVDALRELHERLGCAFRVEELAGGYQLLTRPEFHPWLVRLRQAANPFRLTPAAQETLAIVAYRQPVMRADVEAIRGVQCGELLRQLMEKGLLRIVRRDESLGRPVLYGTTKKFLQLFGLRGLADLPLAEQFGTASENPAGEGR